MCGIAGYIGRRPPSEGAVQRCLYLMGRRGPDAAASYTHAFGDGWHVSLLHTRLSIIDINRRADQPMRRDGRVIVFNGEIYNYLELKRELEGLGETFETAGDTEVLLAGLNRQGAAWLDGVEGMWAWAWYDEARGQLVLSRDRFGEKPLYVMEADGGWYFGSEIKFLAELSGRALRVDTDHLLRYLVNGYKSLYKSEASFFEGVRELRPGRVLTLDAVGGATENVYWRPQPAQIEEMSFAEAVSGARDRLIESVRLRLRADVPMAFCMSGGVDSNSLISIAKQVFGYDVHGFTVTNTDSRYEERDTVDAVVRELGIRHTALPLVADGFLANLRELVRFHDAPVYTISYYVHWQLMQRVSEHGYRISVSGTAADELFTGYFDHHNAYLAEVAADASHHAQALADWQAHVRPVVRNPYLQDADLFVRDPGFRDHIYFGAEGFSAALLAPWQEHFEETRYAPGLLRNRMLNELFHESVPVILHEDDLNAMYYSIENRSPFLDRQLFDFANSIPTRHLIRGGYGKAVLREAMRGIVPNAVIDSHRKVGFNAPLLDLLDTSDPAVVAEILAPSPIFGLVDRSNIVTLLERSSMTNSESKFLFNFLCAKFFLEQNSDAAGAA
ncbi:asparagine synthase (glutamine-hydrolyzing) [Tardiphaga sp. vice278]|uniref:asparagine synthase (glutamine-hydrolyzing) n=1 Tax=Tardiphaga sp. vice278 TaxID=2592815 RepID=UPI0011653131|nr:asparagine synthase (glutamine-hydrolyzing) [Tardiphaga sp. vice278]QDM17974.1 asparagine synthase (glutamine-hydrolyzing) [Tardiphaga sp. vice278]